MKPKAFLFTLLASVLLVLLVAACKDDKNDNVSDCAFGTPYSVNATVQPTKIAEFNDYPAPIRSLSVATKLTGKVFKDSIKENLASPYGTRFQLYNYVITAAAEEGAEEEGGCEILVAEWSSNSQSASTLADCKGGATFLPEDLQGKMINSFPEDLDSQLHEVDAGARRSICWLGSNSKQGLLDALQKHFMLAQGPGTSIAGFAASKTFADDPSTSLWIGTEVAYAGEIIVDLASCKLLLNSNSGTYRPDDRYLGEVTRFVIDELDLSLTISDIKPWC